jgi:opacity protein-like surface antigen
MVKKLLVLAVFSLIVSTTLAAQSTEAATSGTRRLFVGAEFSTFNPDWGCVSASAFSCWDRHLSGVAAVVDANHVAWKLGVEGEARWLHWGGPGLGLVESSYMAGPRYPLYKIQNLTLYAKGLVGEGRITRPTNLGTGSYFALAPGGTAEYSIKWKVVVRAEYEYQFWPSFQGLPGQPANGLTPNGFSFGVSYRL